MGKLQPTLALAASYIILSFCFLFIFLVVYVICCRFNCRNINLDASNLELGLDIPPRSSGIDKKIIASLPLCRFSSLRSSRVGVVCSVCLSKFEESDILHLLPKCGHAFHISCIDSWLEMHSSCPLCRQKVDPEDISSFTPFCISEDSSNSVEFSDQEWTGTNEPRSSALNAEGSRPMKKEDEDGGGRSLQDSEHRVAFSERDDKYSRHTDVGGIGLMFLNSEMINSISEQQISAMESCKHNPGVV